jgi:hypothetical protein
MITFAFILFLPKIVDRISAVCVGSPSRREGLAAAYLTYLQPKPVTELDTEDMEAKQPRHSSN